MIHTTLNLKELMHKFIWTISPVSHRWLKPAIFLLSQIKKRGGIVLVLWHWPFSRTFFSVHYRTSKRQSPFTWPQSIITCWKYLISTAHFYKACKSEPILQKIDLPKKNEEMGVILFFPINHASLQIILSIRGGTDGIWMSSLKHVRFFPQRLIRMCQLCWWQSYLVEGLQEVIYKAEMQLLDL